MDMPKILIVDDDPDLCQAMKLRLRANHYDTVHAVDGYSAIALAYKEHPNLIILDLGLPAGNGFVVLARLQDDDKLSRIPVIVLTARDPQGNEQRALQSGACAFLPEAGRQRATVGRDSCHSGASRGGIVVCRPEPIASG